MDEYNIYAFIQNIIKRQIGEFLMNYHEDGFRTRYNHK